MWHEGPHYLLSLIFVAIICHLICKKYVISTCAAAALSSGIVLAIELIGATRGGEHVNLGFAPLSLFMLTALAIPVSAIVGLPFLIARHTWRLRN